MIRSNKNWIWIASGLLVLTLMGCECSPGGEFEGCVPDDCADLGRNCGEVDDGCGGTLFCGTCTAPETCGGAGIAGVCGQSSGVDCTPRSCSDIGDFCGPMPDGCGGFVTCVDCESPEICGGQEPMRCGIPDPDSFGSCEPLTCEAQGIGCGLAGDGCGDTIDCGTCPDQETCGGAGVPSQCGTPDCVPLSCQDQGIECGRAGDGCGGLTDVCGVCTPPETCGGGGELGRCGYDHTNPCLGPWCGHQFPCPTGQETTVTGKVYTPNGQIPLANAMVFVPNADLPPIRDGIECLRCEDQDLNEFLVVTITGSDGSFELRNVPADIPFPLVVQIGKWRRVVEIPAISPCTSRELTPEQTRLPANRNEGHIPRIAVSTGAVDGMECVLYKAGVDQSEFTRPTDNGRIHIYRGNGAWPDQQLMNQCGGGSDNVDREVFLGELCISDTPQSCPSSTCRDSLANRLHESQSTLDGYDMTIFGCEAIEYGTFCFCPTGLIPVNTPYGPQCMNPSTGQLHGGFVNSCDGSPFKTRSAQSRDRLLSYVNRGGRLFLSHYHYDWVWNSSPSYTTHPLNTTCDWPGGTFGPQSWGTGTIQALLDTSFERALVFSDWLDHVHASSPGGRVAITEPRGHCRSAIPPGRQWVYTTQQEHGLPSVQQLTFNTPVNASEDEICGRVAYSAFHVTVGGTRNTYFPQHCQGPMTSQEKVLLFMLFDLGACIYDDESGGHPPLCIPLTCDKIGAECGWLSDGCGGEIDCGECPPGETCGGGGIPYRCGALCDAVECGPDNPNECGYIPDGCGNVSFCGECPEGYVCRGGPGVPNECVTGYCESPLTCEDWNAECGQLPDGCGGVIDCGECASGEICLQQGDFTDPNSFSAVCRILG